MSDLMGYRFNAGTNVAAQVRPDFAADLQQSLNLAALDCAPGSIMIVAMAGYYVLILLRISRSLD
jgi:hypothetical protein